MKKVIPLFILVILVFFGCDSAKPQNKEASSTSKIVSKNLNEYFEALKDLRKFNGGVLVQRQGERLLYKAYNMEETVQSLRVDEYSQFDIHSISKLMAQAVVVKLEGDNLINREDKLSKYISDFPNGDLISIEHLIKNQSGLPRGFSKDYPDLIDKDPVEVVEYIKEESLLFEPGAETLYSNLGYQLLYFIISKVTNKPFVVYLDEAFLQPLQMKNTGAHFHLKKNNLTQLVKNHEDDDGALVVVPNIQRDGKNQAKIYSTMEDLLTFINHVKEEPYRVPLKNRNKEIGWSGGGDGILSHAKAALDKDYEIIFFSNYDEIPFGEIIETVEKIMTSQPYDLPREINRQAVNVEKNILEKYVGKYSVKEFNNDIFEYRIEQGKLVFYQNGERNTLLNAESDRTFFDKPNASDYFEFRQTTTGEYKLIFHYKKMEIEGHKIKGR